MSQKNLTSPPPKTPITSNLSLSRKNLKEQIKQLETALEDYEESARHIKHENNTFIPETEAKINELKSQLALAKQN